LRKWLARLPHPFAAEGRAAGCRYDPSILQAEFSLTQVLDRPLSGRVFFEEVIREYLDIGRPDQVQLIFARCVTKRTPGRFRTRVLTEGVTPSLHVDDKHSRIKQYHKEGRALRTETTINDTRDFGIGKRLTNLPALRQVGFQANRRLLDVQRISQDCAVGEDAFHQINDPIDVDGQRASGLRFADVAVQALLSALLGVPSLTSGFLQPRPAGPLGSPAGEGPCRHDPRADDESPAATPTARDDRANTPNSPLPGDDAGWSRRAVLYPHLSPAPPPWPRSNHPRGSSGRYRVAPVL
jgi:hypothetical protein